jgi:hypothetical protein
MLDTTSKGIFQDRPTQNRRLEFSTWSEVAIFQRTRPGMAQGLEASCRYSCPRAWLLTAGRALSSCAPTGVGLCKEEIHGQIGEDA